MKNKRTKLTAILLSALMAVSTISSVTWAADLFSDGSDEVEVGVVGESEDAVLNVEDEVTAENEVLTGISWADITEVEFKYDTNSHETATKVIAVFKTTSGNYTVENTVKGANLANGIIPATCIQPESAIYSATLEGQGGNITVFSKEAGTNARVKINDACTILNSDSNDVVISSGGYIYVPGSTFSGHKFGTVEKVIKPASCTDKGKLAKYYGCTVCGSVFKPDVDENGVPNDLNPVDVKWDNYLSYTDGQKDSVNGITIYDIDKNAHNFDGVQPIALTDEYFLYRVGDASENNDTITHKYAVANGEAYTFKDSNSVIASYKLEKDETKGLLEYAPFNCIGTEIADPENGRDAFYYTYVVCKNCNKVGRITDKVYLKDTSGSIEGDFYEEVEGGNVIGFLAKPNSTGDGVTLLDGTKYKLYGYVNSYISFDSSKKNRINTKDSRLLDPLVPVLENCEQNGYYYIRKYVKDTPDPVDTKRKTVERISHLWGSVEVAPKGFKYSDGTLSATQNDKLLDNVDLPNTESKFLSSGKFVVVRDASGNVVEAKSKNCITTANYELYHQCLICGLKVKTEAKTAQYNTDRHWWPDWSTTTDDEDNKYYQIEGSEHDTYHMKYTYYHRICNWCGKRETQLADEVKEPHRLEETAYDDDYDKDGKDSTLVEPNCGVDGHYDVILRCACRYEDDKSIKQETIPANDKHDFGDNEIVLNVVGDIHVGNNGNKESKKGDNPYVVYAEVVRKCNVCEKFDSNGINNTLPGKVGVDDDLIIDTIVEGRTIEVTEAKKDENGIPYPCSVGSAKITFNWSGKLNGKAVKAEPVTKTVPYYPNLAAYTGRRDHVYDFRYEELVKPTATQEGSRVKVTFCTVCGEEFRETETLPKLGSAPAVKATPVNYNTVTVSWDAVEGAESYKVFNKSNALGISKWQLVATVDGTSYTDTGLVTGAKYRYTVKPVVNGIGGEYNKKGVVVCPKLTAPEIKSVTSVGTNKNKITWTKVDGASGYIVQRKAANGSWTRIATVRGGSNINCRDKKAVTGASYRVRAFRTVEKPNFVKSNVYGPFSTAK